MSVVVSASGRGKFLRGQCEAGENLLVVLTQAGRRGEDGGGVRKTFTGGEVSDTR